MKMKRFFLKLFLTTCFLTALGHKDVVAAGQPAVVLDKDHIYIGKDADGEFIGRGKSATEAKNSPLSSTPNHKTGYLFSGQVYDSADITIELGSKDDIVNLTFNDSKMDNGTHIDIKRGTVNITLTGQGNILKAKNNSPAITVNTDNANLYFKGSGQIGISGSENQPVISGGGVTIDSGSVTLNMNGAGDTCTGKFIQVNRQGSLYCKRTSGGNAPVGSIDLYQEGGTVVAAGLYEIDFENEAFAIDENIVRPGEMVSILYQVGSSNTELKVAAESGKDGKNFVPIKEEFFQKKIKINRQYLTLKGRPTNSSSASVTQDESHALEEDGIISGIDIRKTEYIFISEEKEQPENEVKLAEYISNNNLIWNQFPIDPAESLAPGYYYVRTKASKTDFASKYKILHVNPGDILAFEPDPYEFSAVYKDIKADTVPQLTLLNYGNKSITIDRVALKKGQDTSSFDSVFGGGSIAGRSDKSADAQTNTTTKLTPKLDLEAGTYQTTIQVGYSIDGNSLEPLEIPVTFEVEKAEQPTPTATLQVTNITHNSATLNSIEKNDANADSGSGVEYSFSTDGEWNDKNVSDTPNFNGKLSPETKYYFLARYKETKNYKASEPISTEGETEKAASIDFEKQELIFPYSDRKYTVTVGKDGKPQTYENISSIKIPDEWCSSKTTITIVDMTKNGTQTLTLPAIRPAPTPKAVDEKIIGDKGSITNVKDTMEFRKKLSKNRWGEWEDCPGRVIEQVEPGDYQVRIKASSTDFPSAIASITVHKGPSIEVNLQGADFDEIPYGTPTSGKIIIQNRDTVPVKLEGISLSAENFIITEGEKSLEPRDSVEWGIQPKEKLNVGTYESDIIVSYDDSQEDDLDDDSDDNSSNNGSDSDNKDDSDNSGSNNGNTGTADPDKDGSDKDDSGETQVKTRAAKEAEEVTDGEQSNIRTASIEVKATIIKAPQTDVPPVPAGKSKTATSITLETIPNNPATGAKAQYSKDGGRTWQDSPTFTGLSPNKEYTFVARYAETDNYNASDISSGEISITTDEKNDDDSDGVKPQTKDDDDKKSNGTNNNGTNGNGTNSNGTNGANGMNANSTGTNSNVGNGTGTKDDDSSSKKALSSAKTGDLNNIHLWITLMIGSYLSCAVIIKNKLKKI